MQLGHCWGRCWRTLQAPEGARAELKAPDHLHQVRPCAWPYLVIANPSLHTHSRIPPCVIGGLACCYSFFVSASHLSFSLFPINTYDRPCCTTSAPPRGIMVSTSHLPQTSLDSFTDASLLQTQPSATTPLLADDRRQALSDDHRMSDSEDEALRGQSEATHSGRSLYLRLREILLFVWALLATAGILVLAVWVSHNQQTNFEKPSGGKRNLVFMVSDGMGPASLSLTRSFRQHVEGLEFGDTLTLDKHFWGSSRTRSSSSLVTDSAAGATAFSCGKKSYNGAIAVLPDHSPCGTVLEAAKRAGYMTGLVVTTDITDATPACFSSHVGMRLEEGSIALQQIGKGALNRTVDLMFGGGRCHFLPNSQTGSCREDNVDVVKIAKEEFGWNYINDRASFDEFWEGKKEVPLPMMGLFADHDIPFELDRRNMNNVYPSLSEMAKTALRTLEKATEGSDKGFFLMIEGTTLIKTL